MDVTSSFILEWLISTSLCSAMHAFLILVSKSAIGSVITIIFPLPRGLLYPGELALTGQFPEANSAHIKSSVLRTRAATDRTSIIFSNLKLTAGFLFNSPRFFRQFFLLYFFCFLKGKPNSLSSASASSSVALLVVIEIFIPLIT